MAMSSFYDLMWIAFGPLFLPRSILSYPVAYLSPVFFVVLLSLSGDGRISRTRMLVILFVAAVNVFVIAMRGGLLPNFYLALASHSSILVLVLWPRITVRGYDSVVRCVLALAWLQIFIGIAQAVSLGFPMKLPYRDFSEDFFQGSFASGGARLVAIVLCVAWFIYWARYLVSKRKAELFKSLVMLGASVFTASIVSVLAAMVCGALVMARMLRRVGIVKKLVFVLVSAGFCLVLVQYANVVVYAQTFFMKYAVMRKLPRLEFLENTFTRLPSEVPYQPLVGVGLGNYSSWAQAVLAPGYQERFLEGRHVKSGGGASVSEVAQENVFYMYEDGSWSLAANSIIGQPFSSWISLYGEVGILGLGGVVLSMLFQMRLLWKKARQQSDWRAWVGCFVLMYLTVLMVFDNYLEYVWVAYPLFALGSSAAPVLRGRAVGSENLAVGQVNGAICGLISNCQVTNFRL